MPAQKEEILFDVDWDLLEPEPEPEPARALVNEGIAQIPGVATPDLATSKSDPEKPVAIEAARTLPVIQAPKACSPPPLPPAPEAIQPLNAIPQPTCGKKLVRGERLDLAPLFAQKSQIEIELISSNPASVKLICLGLDAAEIVAGTAYCVGPRQPSSACGGITHAARTDGGQEIHVRASILPANIKRLEVSVVTSDSAANLGNTVEGIRLRAGDVVVAESRHLDPACASSSCATLVEIYERQGTWRMRVIGEVLARSVNDLLAKHGAKTN